MKKEIRYFAWTVQNKIGNFLQNFAHGIQYLLPVRLQYHFEICLQKSTKSDLKKWNVVLVTYITEKENKNLQAISIYTK